jgi:hypothetical protein
VLKMRCWGETCPSKTVSEVYGCVYYHTHCRTMNSTKKSLLSCTCVARPTHDAPKWPSNQSVLSC